MSLSGVFHAQLIKEWANEHLMFLARDGALISVKWSHNSTGIAPSQQLCSNKPGLDSG